MHEPMQVIYDVNTSGNPFNPSIYELPVPPTTGHHESAVNAAAANGNLPSTMFHNFAAYFHNRSTPIALPPINTNDVCGDPMMVPILPHTTRLYFIKLNGLNLQNNLVQFCDLCKELHKSDVHLFAAAELNLDTQKYAVHKALQGTARKTF
jgi:hypothetical protein